jgi:hypothetical protein
MTLRATILIAAALSVVATVALVEDTHVAAQDVAAQAGSAPQAGAAAQAVDPSAPSILGTEISWNADVEFETALLVVVGRSGSRTVKQFTFGAREALRVDVSRAGLTDGRYKYELLLYPPARSGSSAPAQRVSVRSGVFLVRDGFPISPRELEQLRPETQAPPRGGGRP